MSYNKDNWKDKLDEVRNFGREPAVVVEEVLDNDTVINNEIEEELKKFFQEEDTTTEVIEEDVLLEASAGEMIDKLFNLKGDKDSQYGVAKMLNMTGVKVVQAMQKQNPDGFMKTVKALGKDSKIKLATNNALMKMFKDAGVKPLEDEVEVKEEKLSVEKSIEKLTEKNMLGRLAKSMELNEDNKEKLFDYFDKGELQQ